jgi:Adenylate and Guanylate cyclase catalytic domain
MRLRRKLTVAFFAVSSLLSVLFARFLYASSSSSSPAICAIGSEATYQLLADRFEFEARGPIEVKGKGEMPVYLLIKARPPRERAPAA